MIAMLRRPPVAVLARIWPLLFVAFAVAASLHGLQAVGGIAGAPGQPNPEQLRALEEIRWTLQVVVIAAGLFAGAQAGFSYLNAQAFTKQAEDAVKRIETLREELESRFPKFMEAEGMEREAGKTLDELGKVADWRGSYESLDLRRRQRLLTVDSWVAMDMRPRVQDAGAYGRSLYRMALLYGSKYKYNRSLGGGSMGDVERAEYYLKLASDYLGETYYLLNEIGLLYLEFYDPRDPKTREANYREAERLFRKSILNKNDQQRAHYNLGVLAGKLKDWAKAAGHYSDALQFPNWEEGRRPEMECNVVYNAACAWARMGHAGNMLLYLNKTADLGYVGVSTVDRDYEPEGDFFGFLSGTDEQTKSELS
jgi:tetratricopeptide (TPR) repeat protein